MGAGFLYYTQRYRESDSSKYFCLFGGFIWGMEGHKFVPHSLHFDPLNMRFQGTIFISNNSKSLTPTYG